MLTVHSAMLLEDEEDKRGFAGEDAEEDGHGKQYEGGDKQKTKQ